MKAVDVICELPDLFIDLGSPWQNGYIESVNAKMRDELPNGETVGTRMEARAITDA
jgi:putative transposase